MMMMTYTVSSGTLNPSVPYHTASLNLKHLKHFDLFSKVNPRKRNLHQGTKFDRSRVTLGRNMETKTCVYIYVPGPKLLQWNILQITQLSVRSRVLNLLR